jgi:hypothetical protein
MRRVFGMGKPQSHEQQQSPTDKIRAENEIKHRQVDPYTTHAQNLQAKIERLTQDCKVKSMKISQLDVLIKDCLRRRDEITARDHITSMNMLKNQLKLIQIELGKCTKDYMQFYSIGIIQDSNETTRLSNQLKSQFLSSNKNGPLDIQDLAIDDEETNEQLQSYMDTYQDSFGVSTSNITKECDDELAQYKRQIEEDEHEQSMSVLENIPIISSNQNRGYYNQSISLNNNVPNPQQQRQPQMVGESYSNVIHHQFTTSQQPSMVNNNITIEELHRSYQSPYVGSHNRSSENSIDSMRAELMSHQSTYQQPYYQQHTSHQQPSYSQQQQQQQQLQPNYGYPLLQKQNMNSQYGSPLSSSTSSIKTSTPTTASKYTFTDLL